MRATAAAFRPFLVGCYWTVLVVAVNTVQAQQEQSQQESSCPLNCGRYGVCVPGVADFLDHPTEPPVSSSSSSSSSGTTSATATAQKPLLAMHQETSRGGFHCHCEPGWTGIECDIEFLSCAGGGAGAEEEEEEEHHHPSFLTSATCTVTINTGAIVKRPGMKMVQHM